MKNIEIEVESYLQKWVNTPAVSVKGEESDLFYPIHYASFYGNSKMIKFLVRIGANPYTKTLKGVNCMHVAA
jgi:Ankyrin repeat